MLVSSLKAWSVIKKCVDVDKIKLQETLYWFFSGWHTLRIHIFQQSVLWGRFSNKPIASEPCWASLQSWLFAQHSTVWRQTLLSTQILTTLLSFLLIQMQKTPPWLIMTITLTSFCSPYKKSSTVMYSDKGSCSFSPSQDLRLSYYPSYH